jgi:hypothetical protein
MWIWIALGLGGVYYLAKGQGNGAIVPQPPSEVSHAVTLALAHENRSDRLADFATAMAPTYPMLAAQLHARSLVVKGVHPITAAAAKRAVQINPAILGA